MNSTTLAITRPLCSDPHDGGCILKVKTEPKITAFCAYNPSGIKRCAVSGRVGDLATLEGFFAVGPLQVQRRIAGGTSFDCKSERVNAGYRPHARAPRRGGRIPAVREMEMKFGYFTLSDNHYDDNSRDANSLSPIFSTRRFTPRRSASIPRGSASIISAHSACFPVPIWCSPMSRLARNASASRPPLQSCRCIIRSGSPSNGRH